LLATLALGTTGCGGDEEGAEPGGPAGDLETLEPGKLTVGSDIPYEPFEFGRGPAYEGFDVDVVTAVGDKLGLEVEFEDTSFDTIFRDLAQGKFDVVASATTITPERERTVSFSEPYFAADQSLMVEEGSDIESVDDLGGRTIGAQKGTTGAEYAENETDAESVRTYAEIGDAFNALEAGQIEAVINDFAISKFAEQSRPNLTVIEEIPTDEEYGLAVNKDSTALLEAINGALAEIREDGTYAEIYRKWFEEEPPEDLLRPGGGGG
jgi:ABC-type amino acid transport substrate-binding protein